MTARRSAQGRRVQTDLIILDVNMPKLSGFDVALRLKGDKELKVIRSFCSPP